MAKKSVDIQPDAGDEVFEKDAASSAGTVREVHHASRRGPKDTGDLSYYVTLDNDRQCHVLHNGTRFDIL